MATDINTQLQNISTDVTAIGNVVNRLLTIFSGGGVQNPDLATMKAELQTYASNAGNISTGVLATAHGGTGRSDGMVTDVYDSECGYSLKSTGRLGFIKNTSSLTNDLESFVIPGFYYGEAGANSLVASSTFENKPITDNYTLQLVYSNLHSIPNIFLRSVHKTSTNTGNKSILWLFRPYTSSYSLYLKKDGNDKALGSTEATAIQSIAVLYQKLLNVTCERVTIYVGPGDWDVLDFRDSEFKISEISISALDSNNPPVIDRINIRGYLFNVFNVHVKLLNCWKAIGYTISNVVCGKINIDYHSFIRLNDVTFKSAYYGSGASMLAISNSSVSVLANTSISFEGSYAGITDAGFIYLNNATVYIPLSYNFDLSGTDGKFIKYNALGVNNISGLSLEDYPGSIAGVVNDAQIFKGRCARLLSPIKDNTASIGEPSLRWAQIYASTGTINTSDEREKTNITDIPENVLLAWGDVNFNQFQFKDAFAKKGTNARLHSALVAQRVIKAFSDRGLDATKYGLLCFDAWEEVNKDKKVVVQQTVYEDRVVIDKEAVYDEKGVLVTPEVSHTEKVEVIPEISYLESEHQEAGSRYGIRYEEALCMEAAYQRYRANKLEERIIALEAKIK